MASSLETLVKILILEQAKGHKNEAVIGGFARFARHWAREAHSQARSEAHHHLVDTIADGLRRYEELTSVEARAAAIEELLGQAQSQDDLETVVGPQSKSPRDEGQPDEQVLRLPQARHDVQEQARVAQQKKPKPAKRHSKAPKSSAQKPKQKVRAKPPATVRERRGYARGNGEAAGPVVARESLEASTTTIDGIGSKRAEQLGKLGARSILDLLYFFPRRYDDYSSMKTIDQLKLGDVVTVLGTVGTVNARKTKRGKSVLEVVLSDGTAAIRATWFNQPWLAKQFKPGLQIVISGKVEQYLGRLTMTSPEWEALERDLLHTGRLVPVYALTKGINGRGMRQMTRRAVDVWAGRLQDYLPLAMRERLDLMDLSDAIAQSHFPDSWNDVRDAQARLAFDELFLLQLAVTQQRLAWQADPTVAATVEDGWLDQLLVALPYQLTGAQRHALDEIRKDLATEKPMNRLLQGDVGSGKTVVAAAAMSIVMAGGRQVALMAPTGILTEQHYNALDDLLRRAPDGESVSLRLLTGATGETERNEIYGGLADGSIAAVVGTHALIQEGVTFADLGLAVIDEQHRFGVRQRGILRSKATNGSPHLLVTTATPIPRTLALTLHADLDLTLIDEMPPGRQPVDTRVLAPAERERSYAFIRSQVENGRQAFIIYPLVEESEKIDAKAAVEEHKRLQSEIFPDLRLGLLHGQMNATEKEQVMNSFYQGETEILVSTSVVEVGIDVPNASVLLVEGANRFGLAQLHQFRGRVGRGEHQSYCLLLPDSESASDNGSAQRLRAMEETTDGFKLAEIDWEIRGAGDLLGTRQSGIGQIRFANLMDPRLVETVQREVRTLVERDAALQAPENALIAEQLTYRMGRDAELAPGDIS